MEYSRSVRFRGDLDQLEKCVSRTGLDGSWKKLPDGHRQFVTHDGGVLNWSRYTGTIWFQGNRSAAKEFKRELKAAAKGRIEWKCINAGKSPEADELGNALSGKALRRLSEHFKLVEEELDEEFSTIVEKLEWLEEWMRHLLDHVGVPDWNEIAIAENKKKRIAAMPQGLDTPNQSECSDVIDVKSERYGRAPIGD